MLQALRYCWVLTLIPLITNCGSDDEDPVVDPATLTISVSSTTVEEGAGPITVTFNLDRALDESVELSPSFAGTATRETDYMFPPTVTLDAGSTSTEVNLGVTDDDDEEDTETIEIAISASGLPDAVMLGTAASISISIEDNDEAASDPCPNDNSTNTNKFECTTTAPCGK